MTRTVLGLLIMAVGAQAWSATPSLLDYSSLERASIVLIVEVVSIEKMSQQPDKAAFERFTAVLRPLAVLKGDVPMDRITLDLHVGGYVGFDPRLVEKERYVVFLKKTDSGTFRLLHPSAIAKFPPQ